MSYNHLPLKDQIDEYVRERTYVGGFLAAVLENDLRNAVSRADGLNLSLLPDYVRYLYNHCPAPCWGSPEKVEAWLEGGIRRHEPYEPPHPVSYGNPLPDSAEQCEFGDDEYQYRLRAAGL